MKHFWKKWEPAAWRSDTGVAMLSEASRCFWFEALNCMMERSTHVLSGTGEQLAAATRCRVAVVQQAVAEIKQLDVAELHQHDSVITLISRKLRRESELSESHRKNGAKPSQTSNSNFNSFWEAYPRKTGKGLAEKAFNKIEGVDELLPHILRAVEKQRSSPQWLKDGGQYIPYPATWLNQRRWEDVVEIKQSRGSDPNI